MSTRQEERERRRAERARREEAIQNEREVQERARARQQVEGLDQRLRDAQTRQETREAMSKALGADVEWTEISPDAIVVLHFDRPVSAEAMRRVSSQLKEIVPHNKVLVLDKGASLKVIEPTMMYEVD